MAEKTKTTFQSDTGNRLSSRQHGRTPGDDIKTVLDDLSDTVLHEEETISDDASTSLSPPVTKGLMTVTYKSGGDSDTNSTVAFLGWVDADNGAVNEISSGSGTTSGTSSLGGTDGADGDFTIGVQSDGTIDLENRTNGEITVKWSIRP